jgi:hypothetical protein
MHKQSFIIIAVGALAASASAQTTIFDTISPTGPGYTTTGTSPRFMLGESFGVAPSGGAGWILQSMGVGVFVFGNAGGPQTLNNVQGHFRFYNTVSSSTVQTDPAFLNQAGAFTVNFGTINQTTGAQAFIYNNINISTFNIGLTDGIKGLDVRFTIDGVATEAVTLALRDVVPAVGTTGTPANGFWRDNNNNGIIEVSDARTLGLTNVNPALSLTANPVPEPATLAALGIGAAALIRRRRNRKA